MINTKNRPLLEPTPFRPLLSCAYTYGLDLISQRQPGVTTNFYGYDGLGSVRFLLTLAGSVTNTYVYDAYGTLLNSTGIITNNYRYTGEQFDADLGFYYLRARYLDQNIGRFQTMDSYEGNSVDPLSLHKYLYCHANPVNGIDPSGHDFVGTYLTTISISFNLITYKPDSLKRKTFLWLYTHGPLGKRLMRHYMCCEGTPMTLTIDDMVEVGAVYRPGDGRPSVAKAIDFDRYRQQLNGGPVQFSDMRLTLRATEGATLGQFSAYLSGTLRGAPNDWTFEGVMRYADTYNFEHHKGEGIVVREQLVFLVRNGVLGKGFQVTSELATVKESSSDGELQWKGTGVRNPDRGDEN